MTEADWHSSNDIRKLLNFLCRAHKAARTKFGRRKLRLFACACCRSLFWHLPILECYRQVVELAEQFADDAVTRPELSAAVAQCPSPHHLPNRLAEDEIYLGSWAMHCTGAAAPKNAFAYSVFRSVFFRTAYKEAVDPSAKPSRKQLQAFNRRLCDLLRDVFGNPFAPVTIDPVWLTWNDGTIPKIAQSIEAGRAFESMPVLADVLEEAGCQARAIVDHCRQPAEHARGCWVLDLLLGRGIVGSSEATT